MQYEKQKHLKLVFWETPPCEADRVIYMHKELREKYHIYHFK